MPFFLLSIVESVCALDGRHANSISLYRDFMIESQASASLAALGVKKRLCYDLHSSQLAFPARLTN
jgi:hypothetical protein